MRFFSAVALSLSLGLTAMTGSAHAQTPPVTPADTLVIELKNGPVQIQLRPDLAPGHIARIKQLTKEGFYNGLKFHRVIDGFMAQTGDPKGTGAGGSTMPDLKAEFSRTLFKRGTVGAARTSEPNTANSQFFICFDDKGCMGLTGQYTVLGQVISGMEAVDKIKRGEGGGGTVTGPDVMQKVYLLSDKK
jgi:peptidylprolyl isomerase